MAPNGTSPGWGGARDGDTMGDDDEVRLGDPIDAEIADGDSVPSGTRDEERTGGEPGSDTEEPSEAGLPVEEGLVEEVEEDLIARERDEYLDALRRLQAEFDNYRKRIARQQVESVERATESLLSRLLPVLDALDLALTHSEVPTGEATLEREALIQIASLLRDTLSKEGLERIDAIDVAFDPNIHDAVTHLAADEGAEAGGVYVNDVLRAGYQLKGKTLRPAMVQVRG